MVNKDKTGSDRQSRLRASRVKWLAENAYGLSAEGLIGALMRGECSLSWASVPTPRVPDSPYVCLHCGAHISYDHLPWCKSLPQNGGG